MATIIGKRAGPTTAKEIGLITQSFRKIGGINETGVMSGYSKSIMNKFAVLKSERVRSCFILIIMTCTYARASSETFSSLSFFPPPVYFLLWAFLNNDNINNTICLSYTSMHYINQLYYITLIKNIFYNLFKRVRESIPIANKISWLSACISLNFALDTIKTVKDILHFWKCMNVHTRPSILLHKLLSFKVVSGGSRPTFSQTRLLRIRVFYEVK